MFTRLIYCALLLAISGFGSPKEPAVAIIGAGLAGLTTAYRLQEHGIETQVYEARNRVGGRVFSAYVEGEVVELGGQNISDGAEAKNILRLIEECQLGIQEVKVNLGRRFFTGDQFIFDHQLTDGKFDPEGLRLQLAEAAMGASNMRDVMMKVLKEDDPYFRYLSTSLAGYEGGVVERLSSLYIDTLYYRMIGEVSAAYKHSAGETSITFRSIEGGNSLLPHALSEKLRSRIHLNCPLTRVGKRENGAFELRFEGGEIAVADIVVLAIPCTVYEDIVFEEGVIPKERLACIQNVQYGTNAKIFVPMECSQEQASFINDRIGAFFWTNSGIMTLYFTGEFGRFTPSSIGQAYERERPMLESGLKDICPPFTTPQFARDEYLVSYEGPIGFSWPNDPYAKGSYSFIGAGQETVFTAMETAYGEEVKTLFAPIDGALFFAGEHTTILEDVLGTMEAASESGERTARMILASLKPSLINAIRLEPGSHRSAHSIEWAEANEKR